jgi:hypothetical protein
METEAKICKLNERFSDNYDTSTLTGTAIECLYRSKTFIPSYKNRFLRMIIKGAMTNPCTYTVALIVDDRREEFTLTESDITGVIGSDGLYPFLSEIHFPESINYGREVYIEITCNALNHGLKLDWYTIEGEKLSYSIIK